VWGLHDQVIDGLVGEADSARVGVSTFALSLVDFGGRHLPDPLQAWACTWPLLDLAAGEWRVDLLSVRGSLTRKPVRGNAVNALSC
jgi:hypothetical protein